MKIDYDEIVKDYPIDGLTLRKITNKFVREHFEEEIKLLLDIMTIGNGDITDNGRDKQEFSSSDKVEIVNENVLNLGEIFMGHEMPVDIWLGFVKNMIHGEFMRVVSDRSGTKIVTYDKRYPKSEFQELAEQIEPVSEKEIIQGIRDALKKKLKNS